MGNEKGHGRIVQTAVCLGTWTRIYDGGIHFDPAAVSLDGIRFRLLLEHYSPHLQRRQGRNTHMLTML